MYTQFFGNFLLNKKIITPEQLIELLTIQSNSHVKIGTLAIHAGLMTGKEVEEVFHMQSHKDMRFGELAVEEGYLTVEEVNALLDSQKPDFLMIGQNLVEQNIVTSTELENLIADYESEYEIIALDMVDDQKKQIESLIDNFYLIENTESSDYFAKYINLLFNSLLRFIGNDFTPLNIIEMPESPTENCVIQEIVGDFHMLTAIDMDDDISRSFAIRYLNEDESSETNIDYAMQCISDFMNLVNGLYCVNMSNFKSADLNLEPPEIYNEPIISSGNTCYVIPVVFTFGTVNFILSVVG